MKIQYTYYHSIYEVEQHKKNLLLKLCSSLNANHIYSLRGHLPLAYAGVTSA